MKTTTNNNKQQQTVLTNVDTAPGTVNIAGQPATTTHNKQQQNRRWVVHATTNHNKIPAANRLRVPIKAL